MNMNVQNNRTIGLKTLLDFFDNKNAKQYIDKAKIIESEIFSKSKTMNEYIEGLEKYKVFINKIFFF